MERGYESETISQLAAALAKAQGNFTFAVKDSVADMGFKGGRRKYADLAAVLEAIRKPLAENGLSYTHQLYREDNNTMVMRTRLLHESGEWVASEFPIVCDTQGNKNPIQGLGSTLTYARRYSLSALVGIAQDDDDGASSTWGQGGQQKQGNGQQNGNRNDRRQQAPQQYDEIPPDMPPAMPPDEQPEHLEDVVIQQESTQGGGSSNIREKCFVLSGLLKQRGFESVEQQRNELSYFYGREVNTMKDLSEAELDEFITVLQQNQGEENG